MSISVFSVNDWVIYNLVELIYRKKQFQLILGQLTPNNEVFLKMQSSQNHANGLMCSLEDLWYCQQPFLMKSMDLGGLNGRYAQERISPGFFIHFLQENAPEHVAFSLFFCARTPPEIFGSFNRQHMGEVQIRN